MNKTKKAILGMLMAGGLTVGGYTANEQMNCDYKIKRAEKEICISADEYEAIKEAEGGFDTSSFK